MSQKSSSPEMDNEGRQEERPHEVEENQDQDSEEMPRKRAKKSYDKNRKYLETWETDFPWLTSIITDGTRLPSCKLCRKILQPHRGTLTKHQNGAQQKKNVSTASSPQSLDGPSNTRPSCELKRAELELALATCCHCSINAIDHLGEVIRKNAKGSTLENLRLHRTKCSALIHSVLSPSLRDEVVADIRGKKYSLMVDESTDTSVEKMLVICARYFSEKFKKIVTVFFGLYPVIQATGEALFQIVTDSVTEHGMTLVDCIGIGCDGAAVMVGEHNSVWSRIKQASPHCILNKYICHSLSLCMQKSFETLPANLGYLLTEIPGWFSHSNLCRHTYRNLFETLNEQDEEKGNGNRIHPMPFMKMCATRWLVRGRVVKRILENWKELKAYFNVAMQEGTQDVKYKARMIHNMLLDDKLSVFCFPIAYCIGI